MKEKKKGHAMCYLVDKHVDWSFKRFSLSAVHRQEAETHPDIEPFTHTDTVERLCPLNTLSFLFLSFSAASCNDVK